MQIRFTDAAAKHRVSKIAARYVMAKTTPRGIKTKRGEEAWLYVGRDEGGRELEVIAIEVEDRTSLGPCLLVIHAMPTHSQKRR